MDWLVIGGVALAVSGLTLFSGFGLGTLLLPAFALFFPVEVAVGATAIVHLANNLFKFALLGRLVDRAVFWRFAPLAVAGSFVGAWALGRLAGAAPLYTHSLFGAEVAVRPVEALVGVLILVFAGLELTGGAKKASLPSSMIPLGGLASGVFGGLSGHQGALRTITLARSGLGPKALIATMVAASTLVDVVRVAVYGAGPMRGSWAALGPRGAGLVAVGCLCAFLGALVGRRLLEKATLAGIHTLIGWLLLVVGGGLALGLL